MNFWITWSREKRHLFVAFIFLILYLSPLFILGENAHIRVHDNLDSNIAWYKTLKNSGQLFGDINSVIPQVINGLPRNAYGTEFSGIEWLHNIFPSMLAYAISQAITRVFAFLGMYILLRRHFITSKDGYLIRVWVSLAFALTPFWPSGMLSTLGMPLALWAFLNIREGKHSWKEWLTLFLLPFYSSFVLGFFFFLVAMGLLWLRDLLFKRKCNWVFLGSIVFMTAIYLLIEYRLVYSLVIHEEPTSRDEFVSSTLGFWHTVRLVFKNYLLGHTHVMTLHTFVIVPLSFIALWTLKGKERGSLQKRYLYLFILNFVLSVWYAFWFFKGWGPIKERFHFLNTFNFARFHFLRPLIIYVMFAVGCYLLWGLGKNWRKFVKLCLIAQIIILFAANDEIVYRMEGKPSFKQFYATEQFKEIAKYIGKPKSSYRVASIGIHPAIAQYNGFYTLDTYNNFYPLKYKHQFRKIIAKELEKNHKLKTYFDHWGNRCYIFVDELGKKYDYKKDSHVKIRHLELNTEVFKQMGGRYIFSAVPILNAKENGLSLKKVFDNKDSAWRIYLYEVK
ncbi:hypothetical protein C0971_02545 [Bacillus methanolicus]|uniref:DUF6044 family protein n=1 Tax=Bacillus methanolicus TaxID=1471 RepID=UPI00200F5559|nr:DUF6044 family protein [Bacillus methanolicus]UQD51026.1 hypothetical protein C0971_02545 [Bacillus methanolicus]